MKKSCKALLAILLSATVFLASCDTPDIHGTMPDNWTLYSYEELYGFFCGDPVTGVSEGTEEFPEPIGRYIFGGLDETAPGSWSHMFYSLVYGFEDRGKVYVPAMNGQPVETSNMVVRENGGFNGLPVIWFDYAYEGQDITVGLYFPAVCLEADPDEFAGYADMMNAVSDGYPERMNVKNTVYGGEIRLTLYGGEEVTAYFVKNQRKEEFEFRTYFAREDMLVEVWWWGDEELPDDFWSSFSVEEYVPAPAADEGGDGAASGLTPDEGGQSESLEPVPSGGQEQA